MEIENKEVIEKTVKRCKDYGIIIPTFAQLKNPNLIPEEIKNKLKDIDINDVHPLNLFRITWKNEPKDKGLYNDGNIIEFPSSITGVPCKIFGIVGKYFPTGSHKVGAGFGCLVPRLIKGEFDPSKQKAVWPSTGNYCRGGAFDCALLKCDAIAILPEEMSKERFEWLKGIGTKEIFATPGCESNVKEIYDKCWELRKTRGKDIVIFNQFEEFGNSIWHYHVTGNIIEETFNKLKLKNKDLNLASYVSATGSAGTIAAGDYLKKKFPQVKVVANEALQCPTLLLCGFGGHQIEGIGDKHVPWVHNVRNTDIVCAIDDEQCMGLMRLFNEKEGHELLIKKGVEKEFVKNLPLLGISSICNLVSAIKTAKYYEYSKDDVIFFCCTDSMNLYQSRIIEQEEKNGKYSSECANVHFSQYIKGIGIDHMHELSYYDRKRLHNFKYFTWVEQQGKTVAELNELWNPKFWEKEFEQVEEWDKLINEFNKKVKECKD